MRLTCLFLLLSLPAGLLAAPSPAEPIRAGYQRLYQGDSSGGYQHFRALADREPDNLAAAYGALAALDAWGLDDSSRQKEFEQRAQQLIAHARARYDKNKTDKEALFYLANVYGALAAYKFEQNKGLWGAARDAAKAKSFAEDYLRLDPGRGDIYLTLGLYNYYVDIAPGFVKFLRILLFLPKGNRALGLEQIERASREGEFFRPAAQATVAQLYAWLEGRPDEALRLAEGLKAQYPDNPEYGFLLARIYSSPAFEDYARAESEYAGVVRRAEEGHPHYQGPTRYHALRGLSRARQQQWRLEEAIAVLAPTIDQGVEKPDWAVPSFLLLRANYRGLLNHPAAADDARRVVANPKWKDWHKSAKQYLKWMEERRKSGEAEPYAALLPGNRLVAERRWAGAEAFYARLRQKYPDDWQVRYRQAYLEFARGRMEESRQQFGAIAQSNPGRMPGWLKANAMLYLARLHDLKGEREPALKLYKRIVDTYENESAAGAARLGLLTPYRRHEKSPP
ncbi:MAG: tetratricopeptide repeat protein [Acidobacteria bacterium]|nr:tetratricopeptide repeat protein [Acidobacteriota bacterium]